jgi:preprotein translocase subunit SecY
MTFKERLSRWYHHRTMSKTAIGIVVKFLIELIFWFCVLATLLIVARFIPVPSIPNYELFNWQYWTILGSLTMLLTASEFCIFTLPASAVESGS